MIEAGLLRHGEVRGGARLRGTLDDPLTPAGWRQMQAALAERPGWDRVVSSPLRRCADFATWYAQRAGLPLTVEPRLGELHFGAWEGVPVAQLMAHERAALEAFWRDPEQHPPPGGEPLAELSARVLAAWRDLVGRHPRERVLIVTHGGVMRVLFTRWLARPLARLLDFEVPHAAFFRCRIDPVGAVRPDPVPALWQPLAAAPEPVGGGA